ncbi:MAG: type II toxin-antitoxin system VapC family toxin [Terriglobia bacterium]
MILLDTHVVAWAVAEPERLSHKAASAIRRAHSSHGIAIAAITVWELAFLFSRGHLRAPGTVEECVRRVLDTAEPIVVPITPEIAALATQFPDDFPRDPADRLIAATARAEGIPLITRDERIRKSPLLKTVW